MKCKVNMQNPGAQTQLRHIRNQHEVYGMTSFYDNCTGPPILVWEDENGVMQTRHPVEVSREVMPAARERPGSMWAEFYDDGNIKKCDDRTRFLINRNKK